MVGTLRASPVGLGPEAARRARRGPFPRNADRGAPARARPRARRAQGFALLGPAGALLAGLLLVPVGFTVYLGLTNAQLIGPNAAHFSFTGLANVNRLGSDPNFWNSAVITVIFVLGSALGSVVVGLVLALLLRQVPGSLAGVVSGVVIVAWMLPAVTAAMIWYAFSAQGGTLDALTRTSSFDLLTSQPLLTVVVAMVWATAGFAMLVVSAGLRNVPEDVLDSARVDGAGTWARFRSVTFPLLRPTLVTATLTSAILSISNFTLVYVMTSGGPGTATDILPIYSYQQAFNYYNLGYGALIGVVIVVAATALAAASSRTCHRRVI
jgi:multiple sugar transport system permease protein